jgi:hypothetical protein
MLENGKYTETIHNMDAGQIWAAWKKQQLNMGQVATWQLQHNLYFNEKGEVIQ